MTIVMVTWVLAKISGLSWARRWTALLTAVTLAVFLVFGIAGPMSRGGLDWAAVALQLGVFAATPSLLALQRLRQEARLRQLHAGEAERMTGLSGTARNLLVIQTEIQQLERRISDITDVYHVTKETSRALRLPELFAATLEVTPRLLAAQGLRLVTLADESLHVLRARRSPDGPLFRSEVSTRPLDVERAILKRADPGGVPGQGDAAALGLPLPDGVARMAWAGLHREQKLIGALIADDLPANELDTLHSVANQLSLQLVRVRFYEQVEALAVTDALTGLSVRRYFMERAEEELARSRRHELSCTLLMLDLDLFKEKNDTYGHLVGDVVLRDVAQVVARNLRDIDLVGRYGGEEFILLLIETPIEQALPIAERLRQLIEVHPVRAYDELLTQTVSIGAAAYTGDAQTLGELIERADQALYAAKRAGRNRVIRWRPELARGVAA